MGNPEQLGGAERAMVEGNRVRGTVNVDVRNDCVLITDGSCSHMQSLLMACAEAEPRATATELRATHESCRASPLLVHSQRSEAPMPRVPPYTQALPALTPARWLSQYQSRRSPMTGDLRPRKSGPIGKGCTADVPWP